MFRFMQQGRRCSENVSGRHAFDASRVAPVDVRRPGNATLTNSEVSQRRRRVRLNVESRHVGSTTLQKCELQSNKGIVILKCPFCQYTRVQKGYQSHRQTVPSVCGVSTVPLRVRFYVYVCMRPRLQFAKPRYSPRHNVRRVNASSV